jgi:hypothetical protein
VWNVIFVEWKLMYLFGMWDFALLFTCNPVGEDPFFSLLFWLLLYIRVLCFFYKSRGQCFWILPGHCLLFILPSLVFLCYHLSCSHTPDVLFEKSAGCL